jgi:hypothetical protein
MQCATTYCLTQLKYSKPATRPICSAKTSPKKAFKEKAGCDDGLVGQLRKMTLKRDEDAPIDPTADDLAGFEERRYEYLLIRGTNYLQ